MLMTYLLSDKTRCDQFGKNLNQYVPNTNLGELRLYAGCVFSRNHDLGTITISQQAFAEKIVAKFGVARNKETPTTTDLRLHVFDPAEPDVEGPVRSLIGH